MKDASTARSSENAEPRATIAREDAYVPPAFLWEQVYVALQTISEPPCIPGQDPRCTP